MTLISLYTPYEKFLLPSKVDFISITALLGRWGVNGVNIVSGYCDG